MWRRRIPPGWRGPGSRTTGCRGTSSPEWRRRPMVIFGWQPKTASFDSTEFDYPRVAAGAAGHLAGDGWRIGGEDRAGSDERRGGLAGCAQFPACGHGGGSRACGLDFVLQPFGLPHRGRRGVGFRRGGWIAWERHLRPDQGRRWAAMVRASRTRGRVPRRPVPEFADAALVEYAHRAGPRRRRMDLRRDAGL